MLARIISLLLIFIGFSFAQEIDFGAVRLKVIKFYPAKEKLYEKEPIFIRFDFFITKNKTSLPKEVLLSFIKLTPIDKKLTLSYQNKSIHPDEIKLRMKNVIYLKSGWTDFPFELTFDTQVMKGLLPESTLKALSKRFILKKEKKLFIIPTKNPYVGDFKIKTNLQTKGNIATLTLIIEGKGYPSFPDYKIYVKNGSAKKVGNITKSNMGQVASIQKFKIVFSKNLEILPVEFSFFNPFEGKIKTIKTKKITKSLSEKTNIARLLSPEEKQQLYLQTFKKMYPQYFEKSSLFEVYLHLLYRYKNHIFLLTSFLLVLSLFLIRKLFVSQIPKEIKEILFLELNKLTDLKKLFKYLYTNKKLLTEYLAFVEKIFYKGIVIKNENGLLKVVKTAEEEITPYKIHSTFLEFKNRIIYNLLENYSSRKKTLIKGYLFLHNNFGILMLFTLLLFATSILQMFVSLYPQQKSILLAINLSFFIAFIIGVFFMKKPAVKVSDD